MVYSKADTWWVEIRIHYRPNNYFVPSLSFSNNQLAILANILNLATTTKMRATTQLYVAQYNESKCIVSLNWLGIKVIGKPLSMILPNMRVKPRAVPLNAHAKVVYIYIYHDHVKLQRRRWLHIGHMHPNTQVSIYIYLPEVSIYILTQVSIYILTWDVT